MEIVNKLLRKAQKVDVIDKIIIAKQLSPLFKSNDPAVKMLATAIDDAIKNKISAEEKVWIRKIEDLRDRLSKSTDEVVISDYGAGSAESKLTDKEMYQGKIEKRIVGQVCISASKPYKWALVLFKIVRAFRPLLCLELGTAVGISAAYQAAALKINNNNGRLITIEGAESLASLATKNFNDLGLQNVSVIAGRFQDRLKPVLEENAPVDFVFIDGHHDGNATLSYFRQILPYLKDRSIIIFDDISWSQSMRSAWKDITKDEKIKFSIDLSIIGVCIAEIK